MLRIRDRQFKHGNNPMPSLLNWKTALFDYLIASFVNKNSHGNPPQSLVHYAIALRKKSLVPYRIIATVFPLMHVSSETASNKNKDY